MECLREALRGFLTSISYRMERKLAVGRQRIMEEMKEALLRGDDAEALERARELTGLPSKRL